MPIIVGNNGQLSHSCVVTKSDPGPPRTFAIFDPDSGHTLVRTEDDLRNGKLGIGADPKKKNPGLNQMNVYLKPTVLPVQ